MISSGHRGARGTVMARIGVTGASDKLASSPAKTRRTAAPGLPSQILHTDNTPLTAIFHDRPGKPVPERLHSAFYLELRMTQVVVTTGGARRAVNPISTNQHPAFYRPGTLPVAKTKV